MVRECQKVEPLGFFPSIKEIVDYAVAVKNWDDAIVWRWPEAISNDLSCGDKHYAYRESDNGDYDWEVFGTFPSSEEDSVGVVETEHLAALAVAIFHNPTAVKPEYRD